MGWISFSKDIRGWWRATSCKHGVDRLWSEDLRAHSSVVGRADSWDSITQKLHLPGPFDYYSDLWLFLLCLLCFSMGYIALYLGNLEHPWTILISVVPWYYEANQTAVIEMPVLGLLFRMPDDGLPIFHSWLATAKDIFHQGFEDWREMFEVRPVENQYPAGNVAGFQSVVPVKGIGRASIILWGILWGYLNKDSMDSECMSDFIRLGGRKMILWQHMVYNH